MRLMWYMHDAVGHPGAADDEDQDAETYLDGRGVRVEEMRHLIGGDVRPRRRHHPGQCDRR